MINLNGNLIDAVQQDNLIYILFLSNDQGIVATLNPLNQEINYQQTQLQCTQYQFSGQQLTCFDEGEDKFTQLNIFSFNQISFNYETDNIVIVSSFAQNDLQQNQQQQNSDRILDTRNNNDGKFFEKDQFRNLKSEKINFEPQPNQEKILIKPLEVPFLQYKQINLNIVEYQFKSYNEINKVVVFTPQYTTLYYLDASNPNNPLLAANLINITSVVCQNQINNIITLVLSQDYTNYYSYLANIQYNLSSSQYNIQMIRKLDYSQGNLKLCLIDNQTLLTVVANKLGCQIYNLNNSDTNLQFSYNFTLQNNLIIEQALIIERSFIITIIQFNPINALIKIVPYDQNGFQTKNAVNYQISINYFGQVSLITSLFYDQQNQIFYISNQYEIEIIPTDPKQQKLYANVQGSKMILNYGNLIDLQYSDIDGATYLTYEFGFSIIYDDFKKQPFTNYVHKQIKMSQIFGGYFFLISDYGCIIVDTKYKSLLTFNIDSSNIRKLEFKSNNYYALAVYKIKKSQYLIFIIQGYNQISSYQFASDPNFGNSSFFQIGNRIISQLEKGIFRQYIIQAQQLYKEDQFSGKTIDNHSLNNQIVQKKGQISQLITFNYDTQSMMYYDYTTEANLPQLMTICNLNIYTNTIYKQSGSILSFLNLLNHKLLEVKNSQTQVSCLTQQAKNYQIILSNGVLYRYNLTDFSNIVLSSQYQALNLFIINDALSNFLKNEKQFLVLNINNNQTVIYDTDTMMLKQTVLNVDKDDKIYQAFGQNQIALFNSTYAATIYDNSNAFTSFCLMCKLSNFSTCVGTDPVINFGLVIIEKDIYVLIQTQDNQFQLLNQYNQTIRGYYNYTAVIFSQEIETFIIQDSNNNQLLAHQPKSDKHVKFQNSLIDSLSKITNDFILIEQINCLVIQFSNYDKLAVYNYEKSQFYLINININKQFYSVYLYQEASNILALDNYSIYILQLFETSFKYSQYIQDSYFQTFLPQNKKTVRSIYYNFASDIIYIYNDEDSVSGFKIQPVFQQICQIPTEKIFICQISSLTKQMILVSQTKIYAIDFNKCSVIKNSSQELNNLISTNLDEQNKLLIDPQKDLVYLINSPYLSVYQLSNLQFLLGYQYGSNKIQLIPQIIEQTNEILIYYKGVILNFDINLSLFGKQEFNNKLRIKNYFEFNIDNNQYYVVLYQNTGIIQVKDKELKNILYFKLQIPLTLNGFNLLMNKINNTTLIIFLPNQQIQVFDITQMQIIQNINLQFQCQAIKFQQQNSYCQVGQTQIFKLQNNFSFDQIFQISQSNGKIIEYYILSEDLLAIITDSYQLFIYSQQYQLQQVVNTKLQRNSQVKLFNHTYLAVSSTQSLEIFNITLTSMEINPNNLLLQINEQNQMQSFTIMTQFNNPLLIYSSNYQAYVYDLAQQKLMCYLQNAQQFGQKFVYDENYFYILGFSNVIIYDILSFNYINYYNQNSFKHSQIVDIQRIYQDYFILIQKSEIQIIKVNIKNSDLVQSFKDIPQPEEFSFKLLFDNFNKLSEINIQVISSDAKMNLFTYSLNQTSFQQNQISQIEVTYGNQVEEYYQTSQRLQLRVSDLNGQLGAYIISIQKQLQDIEIPQIKLYQNIISPLTLLKYKTLIDGIETNQQFSNVLLTSNNFLTQKIQDQKDQYLSKLAFIQLNIKVNITSQDVELNKYGSLNYLLLDQVNLIFFNYSSTLFVSNITQIIIQSMTIQDQYLIRNQSVIKIQNSQSVLIEQLDIKNINLVFEEISQDTQNSFITFNNITNIYINYLNIQNLKWKGKIIQILFSSNITINNLIIDNSKFQQYNLFEFIMLDNLEIKNLILTNISYFSQSKRIMETEQPQRISRIIYLQGVYKSIFQNIQVNQFNNTGLLFTEQFQKNDVYLFYNSYLNFNKLTIQNVTIDQDFSQMSILLEIKALNCIFQNFKSEYLTLNGIFAQIEAKNQIQITDSNFAHFQFTNSKVGGMFSIQSMNLFLNNTIFKNSTSLGFANALQILSTQNLWIQYCKFINLTCSSIPKVSSQQSAGAIEINQAAQAYLKFNTFKSCVSQSSGGSLYISLPKQQSFIIIDQCIFENNYSKLKSGGAIFVENSYNITVISSTFNRNQAKSEKGGAIAIMNSNLFILQDTIFEENESLIGGAIWYDQYSSIKISKEVKYSNNSGICYGQNLGSRPRSIQRVTQTNKIILNNDITGVSSGNQLNNMEYFNFFDEENNPLKCIDINSMQYQPSSVINEEINNYNIQIDTQKTQNILVKQQQMLIKNNIHQLYEFNPIILFKQYMNQTLYIVSNNDNLQMQIQIRFRVCGVGEIVQVDSGFVTCYLCPQDRYSLVIPNMETDQNKLNCLKCPIQAKSCSGNTIILNNGYWRINKLSDEIYTCNTKGCIEDSLSSKFGCDKGYIGPLCDSCDSKGEIWNEHFGKKNNDECLPCKQALSQYLYFFALILFYIFYITNSINSQFNKKMILFKLDVLRKMDLFITSKSCSQGQDLYLWIKIFINYFQIFQIFFLFTANIPQQIEQIINLFGEPVKMTVASLDCLFIMTDKFPLWFFRIIVQISSVFIQYLLISLIAFYIFKRKKLKLNLVGQKKFIFMMVFGFFYLFYQPSISKLLLQGLFCRQIAQKQYLIAQLNYECYSDTHLIYIFTIIIPFLFIWCVCIPFYYYRKLKAFQNSPKLSNRYEQILTHGILYKSYKTQYAYWEIIKILKKLLLMILINTQLSPITQIIFIQIILLFYQYFQITLSPFQNQQQQNCEKFLILRLNYSFIVLGFIIQDSQDTVFSVLKVLSYISLAVINLQVLFMLIYITFNNIEIKQIYGQNNVSKITQFIIIMKRYLPYLLYFIRIRRVSYIRVHKLWKKVIIKFRKVNISKLKESQEFKIFSESIQQQNDKGKIQEKQSFKNTEYQINKQYSESKAFKDDLILCYQTTKNDKQLIFDSQLIQELDQQVNLPISPAMNYFYNKKTKNY
ncbi:transmembrane protein, putative (macronuclear) [Tetrahymena thermophila SB210]|uniref:Transmembrane protein, putative n=1 Tax=Tetrahymena thermophila (strain SB210) TaxID=312017 RepID=Q232Q5_TETTS|nr:transmembrane protein, putative [Tetrahymena thermophila SB210]EAR91497.2 transmembrane protein, putative [Tetrahymena thermophila SB210]|eukprot:XP_001011742.2 transmembrane protein, putative [Tetrahymena thermophila SB210]